MSEQTRMEKVVAAFDLCGEIPHMHPNYGGGHINQTTLVTVKCAHDERRFIVQRINKYVFKNPPELMHNIIQVTDFLRRTMIARGIDPYRRVLDFIPTREGLFYWIDDEGEYWRIYHYVGDTVCYQRIKNSMDFYQSGTAFGRFQNLLSEYPAETLHETIPDFHNTPVRVGHLRDAVAADSEGRVEGVRQEIDFVLSRAEECHFLVDLQKSGKLPTRVTHNDTKLNNVLFDTHTDEAICVIDLDTVMPGLVAYDFGDSIRFGASTAAEDEPDLDKVHFDLNLYDHFSRGFLETAGAALTDCEIDTLPWGARLITLEIGMRFLTDYLAGDVYFRTHRPGHNLDRARTQFKLVSDMEREWEQMNAIIQRHKPQRAD